MLTITEETETKTKAPHSVFLHFVTISALRTFWKLSHIIADSLLSPWALELEMFETTAMCPHSDEAWLPRHRYNSLDTRRKVIPKKRNTIRMLTRFYTNTGHPHASQYFCQFMQLSEQLSPQTDRFIDERRIYHFKYQWGLRYSSSGL